MKKKIFVFIFLFVAVSCGIGSLVLSNAQKNSINVGPSSLSVESLDGNYFLVAEQNSNYEYRFKIEQFLEGEYYSLGFVDSKTNALNLSEQNINIIPGAKYRFSVCYAKASKKATGKVVKSVEWSPSWVLDTVDYSNVVLSEQQILSWRAVYLAERYEVRVVDKDGNAQILNASTNSIDLSAFSVGNFKVFIVAKSSNDNLFDSNAGLGKNVKIERQNVILSTDFDDLTAAEIVSTENVKSFSIFVDDEFVASVEIESNKIAAGYAYVFDASMILGSVGSTSKIEIKSNEQEFVFESDLFVVQ